MNAQSQGSTRALTLLPIPMPNRENAGYAPGTAMESALMSCTPRFVLPL